MRAKGPCWERDEVLRIVTTDAEEIVDHVFNAVHCPSVLKIADTALGTRYAIEPRALIEKFLAPGHRYVQVAVLGQSGTGKSHLIQWLRLHLPREPRDVVLTIPKVGTSLRGIVEKIIATLPESDQPPFVEKLRNAGAHATTQQARVDMFLNSLAWTIEHGRVAGPEHADLPTFLPSVLLDPNFRRHFFSSSDCSVDRIVAHIFVDPESRGDQDERREFRAGDLPLSGKHYAGAATLARDAIDYINGESGMEQRAISLMTRALEPAIAQTLNFSADDLIALMKGLRVHLARKNQRLILLVEDFSRLQGIDTALLQALVTPPRQEEDQLCELRWAMALTTGYFNLLDDTVKQRCTFVVDMDQSQPASTAQFAVGYLNAIRLGEEALLNAPSDEPVANRCASCERRPGCWEAFGHEGETGLFPFNVTALRELAQRTGAQSDQGFNPRRFLRAVLEPVLNQQYPELEHGEFPPGSLLQRVGGRTRLTPILDAQLQQVDPANHDRRVALLELWDGSGRIVNLPHGVHEAFALPELSNAQTVERSDAVEPHAEDRVATTASRPQESAIVEAIRAWAGDPEAQLSQSHVNTLREHVFAALEAFVDWDALGIVKREACQGTNGLFQRSSINFDRQQVQQSQREVVLQLPRDPTKLSQTAVALEALVRAKQNNGWDFERGGEQLAFLQNELQAWADEVIGQIRRIFWETQDWDPTVESAELLALAGFQSGKVRISDSNETIVAKLFEFSEVAALQGAITPRFAQLNARLADRWKNAQDAVRALASGLKGGQQGDFIRVTPVLRAVAGLRQRGLRLSQDVPDDLTAAGRTKQSDLVGIIRRLADVYREIKNGYLEAIDAERAAWSEWIASVRAETGDGGVEELIQALNATIGEAEDAGLPIGPQKAVLREHIASLDARKLDRALEQLRALDEGGDGQAVLRIALAAGFRPEITGLLEKARSFMGLVETRLSSELLKIELTVGQGLDNSKKDIGESLEKLVGALDRLAPVEEVSP